MTFFIACTILLYNHTHREVANVAYSSLLYSLEADYIEKPLPTTPVLLCEISRGAVA
jgi:hypothetical protein